MWRACWEPGVKPLVCLQSTYIWGFWEDHRLRKLWTEGKLEFVLWDSTAECVGHPKCMQVTPGSTEIPRRQQHTEGPLTRPKLFVVVVDM